MARRFIPATHAQQNWQKLVQVVLYHKRTRVSVNLVQVFFWYKFFLHAIEHSSIVAQKLSGT